MKVYKCQIGSEFKRLSIKRFVSGSKVNYIIEGSKCQPNLKGFIEGKDSRYRPIIGTFWLGNNLHFHCKGSAIFIATFEEFRTSLAISNINM